MQKIKIKFIDFWPGFISDDNYFYNLLSKVYLVELSDQPELIFFSCYGKDYLNYSCIRIFYSAENERPDFTACDYALTFDYINSKKHFRLPLFMLYIDKANCLNHFQEEKSKEQALKIWKGKTKFCCMVVSNPNSKKRIQFFNEISLWKHIDSGGKCFNNVGGPVEDKLEFIKDYKFVISFENSSHPGYTTEKIVEPMMVNSIPIYWGNKLINLDINPVTFINVNDFSNYKEVFNKMIEIHNNDELAIKYLMPSKLSVDQSSNYINKDYFLEFLIGIIKNIDIKNPVANTNIKHVHNMLRKWKIIKYTIKVKTFGTFR